MGQAPNQGMQVESSIDPALRRETISIAVRGEAIMLMGSARIAALTGCPASAVAGKAFV